MKTMEENYELMKKETNEVDERNQFLQQQISKYENEKVERETEYAQREQERRDILIPIIKEF